MTLGVGMNLDLDLGRAAHLLAAIGAGKGPTELGPHLGFHKSMVASIKSWSRHLGLLDKDGHPTALAVRLLDVDPTLSQPVTLLTLYYWLARNEAAEAFHYLVNYFLYDALASDRAFEAADARAAAARAGIGAHSRAVKQRDREVGLMLNALRRRQGFGPLGVLSRDEAGRYHVHQPPLPPAFVAYAVYSEWVGDAAATKFDELEQPARLARVCLLPRPALVSALRAAERLGYLRVEEEAQFNRVSRVPGWDAAKLLEVLYAGH